MPIFDVRCEKCKYEQESIMTACPDNYTVTKECSICSETTIHTVLPPLVSMQPDKYWAGQMVHGQYTTSSSFVKRYEKQNNLERVDRSVFEEVQKKQENRIPEAIKKTRKPLHDIIANEVTQLNLPND